MSLDSDAGWIATDPAGCALVYWGKGDGYWVVSNRAELAAAALHGNVPPRDDEALAWMPYLAWMAGASTSFRDVQVLPPASAVVWATGTEPRIERHKPPWRHGIEDRLAGVDADEVIDRAADELVQFLGAVVRTAPEPPLLRLSGGKDSRLMLAAIHAAGLTPRFRYRTIGLPGAADLVVAERLTKMLGVEHEVLRPHAVNRSLEEFETTLRSHVFQTSGMLGAWDLKGSLGVTASVVLSGLYGEVMRSHFAPTVEISSPDDVRAFFGSWAARDPARILVPEVARRLDQWILQWLEDELSQGTPPEDLPDLFYVEHRLPRWVGTAEEVNTRSPLAIPFQAPACLRGGFAFPHRDRRRDALHFELIRHLHEPLALQPLANSTWDPALYARLDNADRYAAVVPVPSSGPGVEQWQISSWPELRPLFAAELLGDPGSALGNLLDRSSVAGALRRYPTLSRRGQIALWAALTAAVWLHRNERPARYPAERPTAPTVPEKQHVASDVTLATGLLPALPASTATRDSLVVDPLLGVPGDPRLGDFCDRLLLACTATLLDLPSDLGDRLRSQEMAGLGKEATQLLRSTKHPLFEPRLGLTIPFWHEHVGVRRFELFLAHPLSVVADNNGVLNAEQLIGIWIRVLANLAQLPEGQVRVTHRGGPATSPPAPRTSQQELATTLYALTLEHELHNLAPLLGALSWSREPSDVRDSLRPPGYSVRTIAELLRQSEITVTKPESPVTGVTKPPFSGAERELQRLRKRERELQRLRNRKSVRIALRLARMAGSFSRRGQR